MRIALFSSTSYDKEYFEDANQVFNFDITHFETRLRSRIAHLAAGFEAVSEALEQIASITLENLLSFSKGDELPNEVKQNASLMKTA